MARGLRRRRHDVEDHSDPAATGLLALAGRMTPVHRRWEALPDFTGEIVFYSSYCAREFSAYFVRGALQHLVDRLAEGPAKATGCLQGGEPHG